MKLGSGLPGRLRRGGVPGGEQSVRVRSNPYPMKPCAPFAVVLLALAGTPAGLMAQTNPAASVEVQAEVKKPKSRLSEVITALLQQDAGPLPAAPTEAEPAPADEEVLKLETMTVTERPPPDLAKPRLEPKAEKFLRSGTLWEKGRTKLVLQPYKGSATLGFSFDF